MTRRWAMLADDLTGACDAGVAFARAGFGTSVVWREGAEWPSAADVLVVSTETRAASAEEAGAKILRVCERLDRVVVYKKIDSVLRGPVAAEIRAVMAAGGLARAVVCPALPEQGRTVRGGRVYVHGEPLETALPSGEGVETPDAATAEDLREIAEDLAADVGATLAVGSAGLAIELAQALGRPQAAPAVPACAAPVAVVIGSHHPTTLGQLDYLRGAGDILESAPADLENVKRDAFSAVVMRQVDEAAFEPLGRAIAGGRIGGLVVTGGATARVMLDGMGADGIELSGELERGVPWGRVRGGAADGTPIVTKSGGFGSQDCLWRVWRSLRPESSK